MYLSYRVCGLSQEPGFYRLLRDRRKMQLLAFFEKKKKGSTDEDGRIHISTATYCIHRTKHKCNP